MITLTFCFACTKTLYDYGIPALSLFEEICRTYLRDDKFLEIASDDDIFESEIFYSLSEAHSILKFLESKGYVTTTECSQNCIQVRPNGLLCQDELYMKNHYECGEETFCHFCLKGHQH